MAIIYVVAWTILNRTPFGRHVYAIGGNELVAKLSGVKTGRLKLAVYAISGLTAALAAIVLTGRLMSGQPNAGVGFELDVIAAVVLGGTAIADGRGPIFGTLIGAVLLGILNNGLNLMGINPYLQDVIKGGIILLAIYIGREWRGPSTTEMEKKMSQSLDGKFAVITGAASGIGLATTEALLHEGATVVMVDRNAGALSELTVRLGNKAIPQVTDLLDPASCSAMISEVLEKVSQIDILYCNAGIYIGGDLQDTTNDAIDRMLNLNVNAVMKNIRDVLPHMIERKTGDIVVTCSVAGHFPTYWEPVYSGSKWAITTFVQGMRRQMVPHGVRVMQVSPGPVVSALLADWPEENLRKAKESGSLIDPSEVADAVVYMLNRKRTVTIRDMIVLPSNFDRV